MDHLYATSTYVNACADLGEPWQDPVTGLWLLKRAIPDETLFDLCGCHPGTAIPADTDLQQLILSAQQQSAVSLTLVTDPFIQPELSYLEETFDRVHPFKVNYIYDPKRPHYLAKTHRFELRRAEESCHVKILSFSESIESWMEIYERFADRHHYKGWQRYSKQYYATLTNAPWITTAVYYRNIIIAMSLWIDYYQYFSHHQTIVLQESYGARAMFATLPFIITHFGKKKLINFGGGPGMQDESSDGLTRYKKAFANHSRMSYLCGKILDQRQYQRLAEQRAAANINYFPLYRCNT